MIIRSAQLLNLSRLAACIAAAGLLFALPAAAQTQLPPPAYGQADLRQDRIEELEGQLRDATAENERLQYEIIQRDREIQRLRSMVGELAGVNQSLATTPPDGQEPGAAAPPQPRADAGPAPSALNEAQRAQTGTLGTIPAGAAPPAPAADPDAPYQNARALLGAGRLPEAEQAFSDFLEQYPNVPQTANARYWFAFTLLARHNYRDAASNFLQYLQRAPRGPYGADAQVGLGVALIGMGEARQGCAALNALPRQYPNASRSARDRAAREARAADCAA
ncbi:MAG: hypothetical protein R3C25_06315 [Hyphomonadaceae bacterium]